MSDAMGKLVSTHHLEIKLISLFLYNSYWSLRGLNLHAKENMVRSYGIFLYIIMESGSVLASALSSCN